MAEKADAFRVVFVECDNEECVQVEALKHNDGQWYHNNGVRGEPVRREILMMECEDTH